MSQKFVILKNRTMEVVTATVGKERFVWEPQGTSEADEKLLDGKTAEAVLAITGEQLEELPIDDLGGSAVDEERPQTIWIANVTGNPDAPEKVFVGTLRNKMTGAKEQVYEPNLNREPRTLSRTKAGDMEIQFDQYDQPVGFTHAPRDITIKPFNRIEMGTLDANWWLRREHNRPKHERGSVVVSRPPSGFEPNSTWELDDIIDWIRMVDVEVERNGQLSMRADEIRKKNRSKGKDIMEREVTRAKFNMLRLAFFRFVDPKFTLPDRAAFEAFKSGKVNAAGQASVTGDEDLDLVAENL